jgi:hypothetical protein
LTAGDREKGTWGARHEAESGSRIPVLACCRTAVECGYPVASASLFRVGWGWRSRWSTLRLNDLDLHPQPTRPPRRCDGMPARVNQLPGPVVDPSRSEVRRRRLYLVVSLDLLNRAVEQPFRLSVSTGRAGRAPAR